MSMPTGERREVALVFTVSKDSQELERMIVLEAKVLGAAVSETSCYLNQSKEAIGSLPKVEMCIYAPSNISTQCGPL
ncbi:hypothetical protein BS17DRAFT_786640 [Gyrodon lividus]|nr:hypothetical protein BS17DRAFT_786640 [Gyrodon lividus]